MDAKASPRKPYVVSRDKSEKELIFDVVNRSARMGRSDFCQLSELDGHKLSARDERTHTYATAIVLNLKQFHSTIFDSNAN